MNTNLAPLAEIYKVNSQLLLASFKEMTDDDIIRRPGGKSNSMLWIAGHVTTYRYFILRLIGLDDDCPWGELFDRGATVKADTDNPPAAEILEKWEELSGTMIEGFSRVPATVLEATSPVDLPVDDKTILGAIAFLALHESYHIGQLAYVRRFLGQSQLVG